MISKEILLQQLEQYVVAAKQAGTEQQFREQLAAVRALCDVALATSASQQQVRIQQITEQPMPVSVSQPVQTMPSAKLQESDANGDSIFDF